jgi:hypothetical protein
MYACAKTFEPTGSHALAPAPVAARPGTGALGKGVVTDTTLHVPVHTCGSKSIIVHFFPLHFYVNVLFLYQTNLLCVLPLPADHDNLFK